MKDEFEDLREEDAEWSAATPEDVHAQEGASSEITEEERVELKKALEQKTREAEEEHNKYVRLYAEFDNYRKRVQRDLMDFRKYANEQFALELLTVADHLGLALKHAAEGGDTIQGLREGVELVYKQLRDVLEKFGIKAFPAEGQPFDPSRHDAMMQEVTDEVPENTVVQVMQDGYMYHDKVLRHAKVSVSKKPQAEREAAAKEAE
ncbi:MAG TPA: nucleotide exchange factor GrpE [Nitrospirota bacterium]|nr:nucleotide exchange factor GrpE [Nitrospirota bacterium]